ncbi:MAG: DNA polymerase III subunit alpha [Clostridia bacterium]|nr:DNA polymerase III subunit alpha [Clostridia bacterium]
MYLIFDTETTGRPRNYNAPLTDFDNWPRMVQIAWQLHDYDGSLVEAKSYIIRPDGFDIPYNAEKIHGISTQMATTYGKPLQEVLDVFAATLQRCTHAAGHNISFDTNIAGAEFLRCGPDNPLANLTVADTMQLSTDYCKLPGGRGGGYKYPSLSELHSKLFDAAFEEAHNAVADVVATARCFLELIRLGIINEAHLKIDRQILLRFRENNVAPIAAVELEVESNKQISDQLAATVAASSDPTVAVVTDAPDVAATATSFVHLHVHSYFSVLQATPSIEGLLQKAASLGMKAMALTDLGNLYGAFQFIKVAHENNIKAIVGCELYLVEDRLKQKFTKDNPDRRHQQLFLAKNIQGYRNLSQLSSIGWIEGSYGGFPRIDKEVLLRYKDELITTTGGLHSEINDLILNVGEQQAEEAFVWWHQQFGDDFYAQINRHGLPEEERANTVLIKFARKYNVRIIAANEIFYLEKEDSDLHDSLLCIKENEYQSTPVGRGRGMRFGFNSEAYYFKTQQEMQELFADLPEAIANTHHIAESIEAYDLKRDAMMPEFPIPESFGTLEDYRTKHPEEKLRELFDEKKDDVEEENVAVGEVEEKGKKEDQKETNYQRIGSYERALRILLEADYLQHLTMLGAQKRYPEMDAAVKERIDFEISVIRKMGYPGYFLIVQDFLQEARRMGVWVGPGRGSAAGSVVAYCLKITDIDPIEYGLLFERFLNPERVSLPDIDIDFDEDGRERVLRWVEEKYGHQRVAHIITFGKMAPKMAIRDIARVKQLPLSEANRLAKLIPTRPGTTFKDAYHEVSELAREKSQSNDPLVRATLISAEKIEGTVRNIGTHACGIIISRDDLSSHIPLTTAKDTNLLVTQFDGSHIEEVGMLKMDFLGLKTLSIIKDAVENIRKSKDKEINIDDIPHDDKKTFELYSHGDTTGIFQFESEGMKKHLRQLKPNQFDDLIAMNALYRPGPMVYIPNFIRRKHGKEKIEYDLPEQEEILKSTYGITVYQEQVMLLSQLLAGFTKGEADNLRKAMGKKKVEIANKLKPQFVEGAQQRGHDLKIIYKIWDDWLEFANYAFNKSHSTCYAYVSYRMAYLKAHYPSEFMAAVLSRNLNDLTKITGFIEEVRRMNIEVLGPDVNESEQLFIVNKKGNIRFGMAAIKGLGSSVAESIIEERNKNGLFTSVFDFVRRINLKTVNKRSFEALARAGAFDGFDNTHRAQLFFQENSDDTIFIEKLLRFAAKYQERKNSQQVSLFGDDEQIIAEDPPLPECKPWTNIEKLRNEKDVTGFYISGHPLDEFRTELKNFGKQRISDFKDNFKKYENRPLVFGGMVASVTHRFTKDDKPWGTFVIEDFDDTIELRLFSEEYLKYKYFLTEGFFLLVYARIERRFRNEEELQIRITDLKLLPEILDRQTQSITLRIAIDDLEPALVDQIFDLYKKNQGNCHVQFIVVDEQDNLRLEMKSATMRVKPSSFLKAIEREPLVSYDLKGN